MTTLQNVASVALFSIILLALAGTGCMYRGHTSEGSDITIDPWVCQNSQDTCVDQVECDDGQTPCEVRIGHTLRLHVQKPPEPEEISKRVLFIDGVALSGVNALPTGEPGRFRFYLRYEPGSETAWKTLLREPKFLNSEKRRVPLSFGFENSIPADTAVSVRLGYWDTRWLLIWGVSTLAVFLIIWHFRPALKVPVASEPQGEVHATLVAPATLKYSLARVQLAFWSFFILSGYLFVAWMMWDYNILNPGLVALLGVSSATAIGSAVVDKNKAAQRRSDAMEPAPLPQSTTSLSPDERGGKQQVERIEQLPLQEVAPRRKSRGGGFFSFVQDILSDDAGTVEFYRLQNALWTLFVGVTFVRAVWNTAALPELDANLVILMGVSSGTYLGIKASK